MFFCALFLKNMKFEFPKFYETDFMEIPHENREQFEADKQKINRRIELSGVLTPFTVCDFITSTVNYN